MICWLNYMISSALMGREAILSSWSTLLQRQVADNWAQLLRNSQMVDCQQPSNEQNKPQCLKIPLKMSNWKIVAQKVVLLLNGYGFSKKSLKVKSGKKKNCESLFTFQLSSVDLTSVWRILFDEKVSKFVILWLRDFHSRLYCDTRYLQVESKIARWRAIL